MTDLKPYQEQRLRLYNDWQSALNDLANTSRFQLDKYGPRRKRANELEDALKRLDKNIEDIMKINNDEILARQGQDARGGRVNAWTGTINTAFETTGQVVSSIYSPMGGKFGQGAAQIAQANNDALAINRGVTPPTVAKSNQTMYIIVGAVLVLFLFMKKK